MHRSDIVVVTPDFHSVLGNLTRLPIPANKELHKKKLDEVFAFHQRELEELTAKKELTEEQVCAAVILRVFCLQGLVKFSFMLHCLQASFSLLQVISQTLAFSGERSS